MQCNPSGVLPLLTGPWTCSLGCRSQNRRSHRVIHRMSPPACDYCLFELVLSRSASSRSSVVLLPPLVQACFLSLWHLYPAGLSTCYSRSPPRRATADPQHLIPTRLIRQEWRDRAPLAIQGMIGPNQTLNLASSSVHRLSSPRPFTYSCAILTSRSSFLTTYYKQPHHHIPTVLPPPPRRSPLLFAPPPISPTSQGGNTTFPRLGSTGRGRRGSRQGCRPSNHTPPHATQTSQRLANRRAVREPLDGWLARTPTE